jgi:hypothetical protein
MALGPHETAAFAGTRNEGGYARRCPAIGVAGCLREEERPREKKAGS